MKQMQLITKEIERKLLANPLYSGDGKPESEREVLVKFFTPDSNWTWYVLEADKLENGDWAFFGYVEGLDKELGYFNLSDFEECMGPMGLYIERDLYFSGTLADVTRRAY